MKLTNVFVVTRVRVLVGLNVNLLQFGTKPHLHRMGIFNLKKSEVVTRSFSVNRVSRVANSNTL